MSGSRDRETRRFAAAAFVADWATYLVFTAVPLKAIALGGGPVTLGLLAALFATVYIVAALFFGRLSDRVERIRLARIGTLVMALGAVVLWLAPGIGSVFLVLPLFSIGRGLFWPAFQAELGERCLSAELGRRAGWFNVAWSSGKMLGFWTAGHLTEAYGTATPLAFAALLVLSTGLLVPAGRVEGAVTAEAPAAEDPPRGVRERFRRAAWGANFVAFGVAATLNYQLPDLLLTLGFREGDVGDLLGLVMLVQTLGFAALGFWRGWQYRISWLVVPMLVGAVSVLGLAWGQSLWFFLACAPGLGLFFSAAYSGSLFYSLHGEVGRGRNTGIHEGLLGSGSLLLPLAGGGLVRVAGIGAPYLLCALVTFVAAVTVFFWFWPARRQTAARSGA